jgi:hypothetical protein
MKSVLLPIVVAQVSFVLLLAALKSRRRPSRGVQTPVPRREPLSSDVPGRDLSALDRQPRWSPKIKLAKREETYELVMVQERRPLPSSSILSTQANWLANDNHRHDLLRCC